jgi:OsmC-like protein
MPESDIRRYEARAASTDIFGRVLCSVRDHHFVIDGPVHNECPGEEVTPGELFLAAVASCGVELIQVVAKTEGIALQGIHATIEGRMDRSQPVRPDLGRGALPDSPLPCPEPQGRGRDACAQCSSCCVQMLREILRPPASWR